MGLSKTPVFLNKKLKHCKTSIKGVPYDCYKWSYNLITPINGRKYMSNWLCSSPYKFGVITSLMLTAPFCKWLKGVFFLGYLLGGSS